ncbi:hypothetical protein WJX72_010274 [[Myrmecia] bisecta]|uniref:Thiamine phosphate synthase/TenI domain-containing protein n=1 Tax=[Myrmecia] bisecta TaxID=41462 RepID=A0AAW1PKM2_9CHLO
MQRAQHSHLPKPLYLLCVEAGAKDEALDLQHVESTIAECVGKGLGNAVMLKDGNQDTDRMMAMAARLQNICSELGIRLIVENRMDVAAAAGASGCTFASHLINIPRARTFLDQMYTIGDSMCSADEADEPADCEDDMESAASVRRPPVVCGRRVTNTAEALAAQREKADFLLLDVGAGDGERDGELDARSLRMELANIRRQVSLHIVVTHDFCMASGGPKSVMNAGADGLQIPMQKLGQLLQEAARGASMGASTKVRELPPTGRVTGAVLLIAGGTVGAGIIALPVKTAAAGFIPTMAMLTGVWAFMCLTATLLLELSLWYGPGTNLTTMAKNTLGGPGKVVSAVLYIFIYAATLTAYIAEGANFILPAAQAISGIALPAWAGCAAFATGLGAVVYAGTGATERVNSACVLVAVLAYGALLALGARGVDLNLLLHANWPASLSALPIMVVAFTFHNIVPSLLAYLGTAKRVLQAIVIGSLLPLVMYALWEGVILASLPVGSSTQSASHVVTLMRAAAGVRVTYAVQIFSLFAIITSFLGVALGCRDFLKELLFHPTTGVCQQLPARLRQPSKFVQQLTPLLLTLGPAHIVAIACPSIFCAALKLSGTFRMLLFGIIPALMVWRGRYCHQNTPFVPGGKALLVAVLCIASAVIGVEWSTKLGLKLWHAA